MLAADQRRITGEARKQRPAGREVGAAVRNRAAEVAAQVSEDVLHVQHERAASRVESAGRRGQTTATGRQTRPHLAERHRAERWRTGEYVVHHDIEGPRHIGLGPYRRDGPDEDESADNDPIERRAHGGLPRPGWSVVRGDLSTNFAASK